MVDSIIIQTILQTKGVAPVKVIIEYVTVGKTGGHITLTEDVSDMPRLPEVGEEITIDTGRSGLNRTYVVESISWKFKNISITLEKPIYEATMRIYCQAHSSHDPTPS